MINKLTSIGTLSICDKGSIIFSPSTEALNGNFKEFVYAFESENATKLYVGKFCGQFTSLIKNYTRSLIPDSQITYVRINQEIVKYLSKHSKIIVKVLKQDKPKLAGIRNEIKLQSNPIWAKK